jgi:hypothetical protein
LITGRRLVAGFRAKACPEPNQRPSARFLLQQNGIQRFQVNIMSQNRIAELHNLAAHAHTAAAVAHGKGEHLTAHELSKQAHEHSMNAHKASEELVKDHANSSKH